MRLFFVGVGLALFMMNPSVRAQSKIKDFRASNQKVAFLGFFSEFVDDTASQSVTNELRKALNEYSRSYGESSIANFNLQDNANDRYFNVAGEKLEERQKEFLKAAAKENGIDIIILGSISESGSHIDMSLQAYDARIDTLSAVEASRFTPRDLKSSVAKAAYRVMNYLDRDGFVHPAPQDFLEAPLGATNADENVNFVEQNQDEFALNPGDLGSGRLAGEVSIGGDRRPFWETWWFWTAMIGTVVGGGLLAYYLIEVNREPTRANVTFQLP